MFLPRFVLAAVVLMLGAHVITLLLSGADPASTPISQLSRGAGAALHTSALTVLAMTQPALAALLWRVRDTSILWKTACLLLALNAPLIIFIALYFLRGSDAQLLGPEANDPLAILACNVGVIMGLLYPGLKRLAPFAARVNLCFLVVWLALIPVIPLIDESWLGAYERTVGLTLLLWIAAVAWLILPTLATHRARGDASA